MLGRKVKTMSQHKIQKEFIYEGLGFPIILRNVPMIYIRNSWVLNINLNTLQKVVLLGLAFSEFVLTGNQIRFIRLWLKLTQTEFSNSLCVTHSTVVKWEKYENESSKMTLTTQKDLRFLILDRLLCEDKIFRKAFRSVFEKKFSNTIQPLHFDVQKEFETLKRYGKLSMQNA